MSYFPSAKLMNILTMLSSYRKEEYSIIFEDMDIAIINELIEWYTKSTNPNSMKLIFYNCCIFSN